MARVSEPPIKEAASLPQYPDSLIKSILRKVKIIAMVGASGNDIRPSYFAMMYLLNKGYKIIPVNPGMAGKTTNLTVIHDRVPSQAA